MKFEFSGKRIDGIVSILPENEYRFEDEVKNPDDSKARRLKKIIGYGVRRRVKSTTTLSDMFMHGFRYMLEQKYIKKEDIGAIIVVTLCQDYFLPTISNILQGELGLSHDVLCIDIPQACAGYVVGLLESFLCLDHLGDKKVVLCTGEIFNRKPFGEEPKYDHPSFGGDIANITILENDNTTKKVAMSFYNDGANRNNLRIKDGAFRSPMNLEKLSKYPNINMPHLGVEMDGSGVFNFVQKEVPPAIDELLNEYGSTKEEVDYYLFHQPNKFMLQKLADKLEVPYSKVPMQLTESMGNSDSGTIPAVMTTFVSEELKSKTNLCCFSGFGGGLTWASALFELAPLDFCENIISDL